MPAAWSGLAMNHHFAELGDVWKHLPLAEILRVNPPRHYWDTHAGSAWYPLTDSPSRRHGALRFLAVAPMDPDLAACAYLGALRDLPGRYPGSATLAMRALGKAAAYILCDVDPVSAASLEIACEGLSAVVVPADGVAAIERAAAASGVDARDVLVHIDPFDPHERVTAQSKTPIELAGWLSNAGYRVFYWYGYDSDNRRGWALKKIARLAPRASLWCGDTLMPASLVYPGRPGAWGCGVVLANPMREEADACQRLGLALERAWASDSVPGDEPSRLRFAVLAAG